LVTGVQTCALPIYAQVPVGPDVLLPLADHLAPGGGRRVDADADERERGFRENRLRDSERHRDHDGGEGVREDVACEQTAEAGAEGARAVDELLLLDREHLRARLPRDADPPG